VTPYRHADSAESAELVVMLPSIEPSAAHRALQFGIVGASLAVVASALGHLHVSACVLGATVAIGALRRKPRPPGIALRVTSGELILCTTGRERLRARLAALDDVSLETKSIRKVEPGQSTSLHFIQSNVGPEIDVARILFHVEGRPVIHLTEAFLPSIEAVEWTGKIRAFLRSNGWIPHDERRSSVPDDDA
jgi:hypothetical protein